MRRWSLAVLIAVCRLALAAPEAGPGLWRYDLMNGKLTRLGDGLSIAWSKAAQRVIYLQRVDDQTSRLCTMGRDGTGRRVLVGNVKPVCWWAQSSADGRYLATVGLDLKSSDEAAFPSWPVLLTIYDADGDRVRGPVAIGRWEFEQYQAVGDILSWSPTGHRLAITPNLPDQRVPYLLDPATGRRTKFAGLPGAKHRQTWSVDGRKFLIQDLWQPTFSADGEWLAFSGQQGVIAVATDGDDRRHLLSQAYRQPATVPGSADFVLSPGNRGAVRRVDLQGRTVRSWDWAWGLMGRPTATSTRVCWMAMAPRTDRPSGQEPTELAGLWLADADGQVKRCVRCAHLDLLNLQLSEPPSWSDDGLAIFFEATPDA